MSEAIVDELSEKEQACLAHHRQAQTLGISFAEYCRERDLKVNQWYWVRTGLIRRGVIAGHGKADADKPAGFASVRIAPSASETTACRIHHPSGWVIECDSVPQAQWLSDLISRATP
jgi:hypothetical protein